MKFFADHCAYGVTIKFLRGLGYTVETAKEVGLEVADDADILQHARGTDAVLLTNDLDFANILLYPPAGSMSVIVLKISKATIPEVHAVLRQMLKDIPSDQFRGALFVVDRNKYRVRRAPPPSNPPS
jgi:predicted nuclease of predicted toxin-antitoxin system